MGFYVNPTNGQSKEDWLVLNNKGVCDFTNVHPEMKRMMWNQAITNNLICIMLVDNGPFSAMPVVFSFREMEEFTDPEDRRLKYLAMMEVDTFLQAVKEGTIPSGVLDAMKFEYQGDDGTQPTIPPLVELFSTKRKEMGL
jgi:hypothetical protein